MIHGWKIKNKEHGASKEYGSHTECQIMCTDSCKSFSYSDEEGCMHYDNVIDISMAERVKHPHCLGINGRRYCYWIGLHYSEY